MTPEEQDAEFGRIYPEQKIKKEIVYYPAEKQTIKQRTVSDMSPDELFGAIAIQVRAVVDQAMGKVED